MKRFYPGVLAVLVVLQAVVAFAAPSGDGVGWKRGPTIVPRSVTFSSLPPQRTHYSGPVKEGHPEGVWEEAEQELERLKANPARLGAAELGHLTLDPTASGQDLQPLAPTVNNGFEGITQGPYIPSEPTVAAGPLNIFTAGNVNVTVTNKDGSNRVETDGATFFGVTAGEGSISDAQCYYDALRGRFVAIAFTQGTSPGNFSNFYLVISKTNDARGAWWQYKFDMTKDGSTSTSNWSDYESVGISDDKLVMTGQQFTFAGNVYQYPKIRVIDRALAYAGSPVTYVDFVNFAVPPGGNSNDNFVTKAARNLSAGENTVHLLCVRTNGGTRVTYRQVTGTPAAPALSAGILVTVGSYSPPPDAVQKGSAALVPTNDCRPTDFYWRNGTLVVAWHTSATISSTTVSAIRLFRLRTSDHFLLTDETFGAASTFYYYPAVTVDSVGSLYLGFDRSSSTEYPSAYATGKRRSDATLEPSALLKAGLSATAQTRWGDYTGIDNDASLQGPGGTSAWYAGQWTKGTNVFGTWINKLSFSYGQIGGTVSDDCDGSAGTTGDRGVLAGVTLALKQGVTTLATTTSDASGNYNFGYLESGTYDVVVTPPAGGGAVDATAGTGGTIQTRISTSDLQVNLTNAQASTGNTFFVSTTHPVPVTTSLSPNSKNQGDSGFTLTVNGSTFTRCSTVQFDGANRTTTYGSANVLTATLPASDLLTPGPHSVTVVTPGPGGGTSNAQTLTVVPVADVTPPVATVTSPNGGETWKAGSVHNITWTATDNYGVTSIDLAYSTDGGASYPNTIATGIANSGSGAWTVPNAPGASTRVRVTAHDAATNTGSDASDANFTIDRWTITASAGPDGTITPSGAVGVAQGASQAFTITPAAGHHVADVLVDGGSVGAVTAYTFTNVTANHTIAASFAIDVYTITASAGAHGSIAPSGAMPLNFGASQSFTITPAAGYHVADVLVDDVSVGPVVSYDFSNVTANHTIAATFAIDVYTITASAGAGGAVAPGGAVPVNSGASQAFTITPAANHHVADVLVDGGSVGAVTGYTFTNVTANHTIAASFAIDTLAITATAGANGSIAPSGTVLVIAGANQAFTITPSTDHHVADVLVDGGSVGAATGYTFTNVTASHTIAASFAINTHTLTTSVVGGGTIARNPDHAEYDHGSSVALTAQPATGWVFTLWEGDLSGSANPEVVLMNSSQSVTATFADTAAPAVTVLAPNGAEGFGFGSTMNIQWNAVDNAGVTAVDLLLSRTGADGPFDSIAAGIANTGTYPWTVTGPMTLDAWLKVVAHDAVANSGSDMNDAPFAIVTETGVDDGPVTAFGLSRVFPNPARGGGRTVFALPSAASVHLAVLDVQGREVLVLADGEYAAGRHSVAFDGATHAPLGPGLYFARLHVAGRTFVQRFAIMR